MKNIKNANGFTLIELLAVIVVLAIVILMASMAVVPRMNDARKQVFTMEANEAINAASSYLMNSALTATGNKTFPTEDNKVVCLTIQELVTNGDFKSKKDYVGKILVKKSGQNYLYVVSMTNQKLMVISAGAGDNFQTSSEIATTDIKDYVKSGDNIANDSRFTCTTNEEWPK